MNIVDKRKYETFPAPPSTSHEIWCYDGDAWKIACAMAGKYDAHQYNTYRALHFAYSQLAGAISSTPIS